MPQREGRIGRHPTRVVVGGFLLLIALGSALLMLPWAQTGSPRVGPVRCLFTATSAATVTGLTVVDAAQWTRFGELVLLVLVQIGGFGIMTLAAVLVLVASQRLGLRQRMIAQTEMGTLTIGDVRQLVRTIAVVTLAIEAMVATALTLRFWANGVEQGLDAAWSGVFHGVMAFNNAGMSLYDDNLTQFADDPAVLLPITVAIVLGGLGFPVIIEVLREQRVSRWTLHTKITLLATVVLLVAGPLLVIAFEWRNAATLGDMPSWQKVLNGWFQGVSPRTAGFNTIDIGGMTDEASLVIIVLMFIGAGAASTGGGIRVTTFAVVGWVAWNEVQGHRETNIFRRRLPAITVGQALVIIVMSIGLISTTTMVLLVMEPITALDAGFEAASAFGTVGLTRGITGDLGPVAQIVLAVVMLAGRVGPTTLAAAVVSREQPRLYRYPEERPIIG